MSAPETKNKTGPSLVFRLALLSLMGLVLAWSGPGRAAGSSGYLFPFGMGVYMDRVVNQPPLPQELAGLAKAAGVRWTREEFLWRIIEPERGKYDEDKLAQYDSLVATARNNNLEILGLMAYQNHWSSGLRAPSTEQHFNDFADYAAFLAGRYRGVIKYWEIWNEPNSSTYWPPEPNSFHYTQLLKKVSVAVKKVYPTVKIVGCSLAGLSPADMSFATEVFEFGGGDYLDVVSIHPYTRPAPLETSPVELANIGALRQLTRKYGPEKPIWITEMGYATCQAESGVSRTRQAELLVRSYLTAISQGVEVVFWYNFKDDGLSEGRVEDNFGVITNEEAYPPLEPKDAYQAFQTMTYLLSRSEFAGEVVLGENKKGLLFRDGHTNLATLVVWIMDQTEEDVQEEIEIPLQGTVGSVLNMFGQAQEFSGDGQSVRVTVSGAPIYIRGGF
ncbi:MAG: cellulase family glycosylhydrolase [Deltaproteobacteria bacterium]|nr:cellulase family glycosylhydrolase [Deltaproteobacteria bacterium]